VLGVEPVLTRVDRDGGHVVGMRAWVFLARLCGASGVSEEPFDPFDEFGGIGTGIDGGCPLPNDVWRDQLRSDQCSTELEVLGSARSELGEPEIVDLEAEPGHAAGVLVRVLDEPVPPSGWRNDRLVADSLGVDAERFVEGGRLADGTVDLVGGRPRFRRAG
jgi:hypothetical protein